MPAQPYARMLEGLRRAPLLNDQEDIYQEGFPTGYEPDNQNPVIGTSLRRRDPSLSLDSFNRGMTSELRNRIFQSARLGEDNEVGALKGLLGSYEQDIADSPLGPQRQEVADYRKAQVGANTAGFDTPQAQARYEREEEEAKSRIPLREAEIRGQTALDQARAQTEGAVRLENTRSRNWIDQMRAIPSGSGVSAYGRTGTGGYVRMNKEPEADKPMPGVSSLANAVTNARGYYEGSKGTSKEAAAKASLETAINMYLNARQDVDPNNVDVAHGIATDPIFERYGGNFPAIRQAIEQADPEGTADMTDDDWLQIESLVRSIKQ